MQNRLKTEENFRLSSLVDEVTQVMRFHENATCKEVIISYEDFTTQTVQVRFIKEYI